LADRYHIERELGRGGMATAFLATDLKHRRPVALKLLHPELISPGWLKIDPTYAALRGKPRFERLANGT
jgi:serine/threonine protein kinase